MSWAFQTCEYFQTNPIVYLNDQTRYNFILPVEVIWIILLPLLAKNSDAYKHFFCKHTEILNSQLLLTINRHS